ncbi:MAG: prolyl oligopeptidase family serine peptidase [Cyanobacteria bacterium P01_F01_bin.153]
MSSDSLTYPATRTVDQTDDYHGTSVADPYRWLEGGADDKDVQAGIEEQSTFTADYLAKLPGREEIQKRLTNLWDYEKFGIPFKKSGEAGDRYFYFKNDGLQNQSVLYVLDDLDGEPKELLDPNKLSDDGTVALSGYSISEDGKYLAYGLSQSGSDWQTWQVREIETGKDLDDELKWIKFSGASWDHDSKGFYYSRYAEPKESEQFEAANYYQKLYYHRVGTSQSEDVLVYERPDEKEWGFGGGVTEDGNYLVIFVWKGSERKNLLFYKDLKDPNAEVVELISEFDASYSLIDNEDKTFWIETNLDAPRNRVVAVDLDNPAKENWTEIIPEASETLEGVGLLNNQFVASYLKDARSQVKVFSLTGEFIREISLPGLGSAGGFNGKRYDTETFFQFTSFTTPSVIYRYDMTSDHAILFRQPQIQIDPDDYETKQVFFTSKDGTRVPMFISHKKELELNGKLPTLLYGYGGFSISLTPSFSISNLVWMEMGGVFAVANLRGGGEYGEDWHQGGTKLNKQNVFDDFIAAGEWLIANSYASSDTLGIHGGSNGGLLVGACMTQRPELYGAAIPAVGVMDMLRFHKFTIGWAWCGDYGSSDNADEFEALYAYSPLHNLKKGTEYPPTLVTTADRDDRVVPAHSFKFAAALQSAQTGDQPTLIRIETKAGHGAGKPTAKVIEEASDRLAFLQYHLQAS